MGYGQLYMFSSILKGPEQNKCIPTRAKVGNMYIHIDIYVYIYIYITFIWLQYPHVFAFFVQHTHYTVDNHNDTAIQEKGPIHTLNKHEPQR